MFHPRKYLFRFLFLFSIAVILYATLYRETGQGDIQLPAFLDHKKGLERTFWQSLVYDSW